MKAFYVNVDHCHQLKASGLLTELATMFALFFALLVLVLFKQYTNKKHWQESHRAMRFCRSACRSALQQYMRMQMNLLKSQQNHSCILLERSPHWSTIRDTQAWKLYMLN